MRDLCSVRIEPGMRVLNFILAEIIRSGEMRRKKGRTLATFCYVVSDVVGFRT